MVNGLFALDARAYDVIYAERERDEIGRLIEVYAPLQSGDVARANPGVLRDVEVIMSGWGAPKMDAEFLALAPNLRAVFYGAGSIRYFTTDEFWDRGIRITSAYAANAVPVAEYALSQILFALKCGPQFARAYKADPDVYRNRFDVKGAYGTTVGLVSLGMVGRRVRELLRPFDVKVIVYDPFVSEAEASELAVESCPLDEIFARADVVSLHTPLLPETVGMITGAHFESMQPYSTFINTARGAIVQEQEMAQVLAKRPDLHAILDVTDPEPPEPGSPLLSLPNVTLTPHIAGSMGWECARMGRYMTDELGRYLNGDKLLWEITRDHAERLA